MNNLEVNLSMLGDLIVDESIAKHTTFKIGGKVSYFIYPKNEISLMRIIELCQNEGREYKIIGKGSNILWCDEYFSGVVISLDRYFTHVSIEEDGKVIAQSGVSLILLAHEAMKRSLGGLEFACGIPATLGGALFMNAGAYKSQMADIVEEVFVLRDNKCIWLKVDELDYGYRHSIFKEHTDWVILGAKMNLYSKEQIQIKELMDSRRKRRMESQPLQYPNAGSVFRNDEVYPAWNLIEQIGFRGYQVGGAQVSEKHANFIVNIDHATSKDVLTLVQHIQEEVKKKFNVDLKMEVEYFDCRKNSM